MNELIKLKNVSLTRQGKNILVDVSMNICAGEIWSVGGANGAGKSSLLRVLSGEWWPTSGKRTFYLSGEARTSPIGSFEQIAFVSPELQEQYERAQWSLSVWDVVRSGFEKNIFPSLETTKAQSKEIEELLFQLGMLAVSGKDIRGLSKGQLRRALLARALVSKPKLLLLDEALSGLDVLKRAEFFTFLRTRMNQSDFALLYTSHNQEDTFPTTTNHLHITNGQAAKVQPPRFHFSATNFQENTGFQEKLSSGTGGEIVLSLKNANVYLGVEHDADKPELFDGGLQPVLQNISWELRQNEHWLVSGANGSGKSTFARLIAGEVRAAFGAIVKRFDLPEHAPIWEIRRYVGLVTHEQEAKYRTWANPNTTGYELVSQGFLEAQLPTSRSKILEIFQLLNATHLVQKTILAMSHGELKRCIIARALVLEPRLLILDEPFDGLDKKARDGLFAVLEKLSQRIQMILVAHLASDVPEFINRQLEFRNGVILN